MKQNPQTNQTNPKKNPHTNQRKPKQTHKKKNETRKKAQSLYNSNLVEREEEKRWERQTLLQERQKEALTTENRGRECVSCTENNNNNNKKLK